MRKIKTKIFRLYHEDVFGQLIFNSKFTYTFRDITSIFYDRHLKRKDLSRKGISFTSKFNRPKKFTKRKTHIGQRIIDKQKFKLFYGNLRNYQLRQIYYKAIKMQGIFAINFLRLLESRLDIILYRSNFGLTYNIIRQCIIYNKVLVNNKIINKPSNLIKIGDKITIIDNFKWTIFNYISLFYKRSDIKEMVRLNPNIFIKFNKNKRFKLFINRSRTRKNHLLLWKNKKKLSEKKHNIKLKKKYNQQQINIKNYKIILSLYYKLKTYTRIVNKLLYLKKRIRYLNFFIIHLYYFLQFLFKQQPVNYKYTIRYITLLRRFIFMKLACKSEFYNILNCTETTMNGEIFFQILLHRKIKIKYKLKIFIKQFLIIRLLRNNVSISKRISSFNKTIKRNKIKLKLKKLNINLRTEIKVYRYKRFIYNQINLIKKLKFFRHKKKIREFKIKHNIEKNLKKLKNKRLFAWKRRIKYEKYYKLHKQMKLKKRNSRGLKKKLFFLKKQKNKETKKNT